MVAAEAARSGLGWHLKSHRVCVANNLPQGAEVWGEEEVLFWLERDMKLPQYVSWFEMEKVDGKKLIEMDEVMLDELHITDESHRERLLSAATEMKKLDDAAKAVHVARKQLQQKKDAHKALVAIVEERAIEVQRKRGKISEAKAAAIAAKAKHDEELLNTVKADFDASKDALGEADHNVREAALHLSKTTDKMEWQVGLAQDQLKKAMLDKGQGLLASASMPSVTAFASDKPPTFCCS